MDFVLARLHQHKQPVIIFLNKPFQREPLERRITAIFLRQPVSLRDGVELDYAVGQASHVKSAIRIGFDNLRIPCFFAAEENSLCARDRLAVGEHNSATDLECRLDNFVGQFQQAAVGPDVDLFT